MAKIYESPIGIQKPQYGRGSDWKTEDDRYLNAIRAYIKKKGYSGKNVGEIVSFPMADSSASYMVLTMKPISLIHLKIGDGWEFQYAHLMTANEIQKNIDQTRKMNEFFATVPTVGEVINALDKVGIKTTNMSEKEIAKFDTSTIGERYFHVKFIHDTYMIPPYNSRQGYDHKIFKYLVNKEIK